MVSAGAEAENRAQHSVFGGVEKSLGEAASQPEGRVDQPTDLPVTLAFQQPFAPRSPQSPWMRLGPEDGGSR